MRNPLVPPVLRLRVGPDDPRAVVGPRPRGSRRPHTDARVAEVRRLVEQSALTYAEIEARTGVGRASICRWTRDGGWQRPPGAARATDTVPRARASAKLKRRTLHTRLAALAERMIREMEAAPAVDPGALAQALELMKMAKLAARPRHRRRGASQDRTQRRTAPAYDPPARTLARLEAAGIDPDRAPAEAVKDFVASHAPPRDEPEFSQRGRRSKLNQRHAWLLGRD